LTHTCTLLTYSTIRSSIGELEKTQGTVETAVACRLMRNAITIPNPAQTDQVNKRDAVYFKGTVSLDTFNRITNVQRSDGTVIESGLLEVVQPIVRNDRTQARLLGVEVVRVGHDNRS
jgi:hypothetical protein